MVGNMVEYMQARLDLWWWWVMVGAGVASLLREWYVMRGGLGFRVEFVGWFWRGGGGKGLEGAKDGMGTENRLAG